MEGHCTVFAEPSSSRTTFPPRMGNPQRMAAANLGGKKVYGGGGERIIFKEEHNLAFLSTTYSTHHLLVPLSLLLPALPFHLSPPASLPIAHVPHFSHVLSSLCPKLRHQLRHHTEKSSCVRTQSCH